MKPKLVVHFRERRTKQPTVDVIFTNLKEAEFWVYRKMADRGFIRNWVPFSIEVHSVNGKRIVAERLSWNKFASEISYACATPEAFSNPEILEARNERYREFYGGKQA